jgi:hypothetical protein
MQEVYGIGVLWHRALISWQVEGGREYFTKIAR